MEELGKDLEKVNNTDKIIVNADKTSNKYLVEKDDYRKMLDKNVQDDYKKKKQKTSKILQLNTNKL